MELGAWSFDCAPQKSATNTRPARFIAPMKLILLLTLFAAVPLTSPIFAEDRDPARGGGEKLEMVKRKIDELRKAGKHDEAERLEAERLGHGRREAGEKRDGAARKEGALDEQQRQHVGEALKHLHAAGLHEQAERIEQMLRGSGTQAEHAAREHREKAERSGPEAAGLREAHEQMQRALREMQEQTQRALRDTQEQTQRALRETHEQMAKMARAIEELREQTGKPRGDGERRKE